MTNDVDKNRGLYQKYRIERTDGSSDPGGKHERCKYFVLDLVHDKHAIAALEAYANSCVSEFPALYDDLNDLLALAKHRFCVPMRIRGQEIQQECHWPAVVPLGNGCWFCVEHGLELHKRYIELGLDAGIGPLGVATLQRRGWL